MSEDNKKYILAKKIARGGMAEIYIAKTEQSKDAASLCCVKRILPHYANDDEFIQMFRDEAKICQRFNHPNLIKVSDFTEIEGTWAIVMDLVAGSDLRAIFAACEKAKTRLTVPMVCYIVAEAARGLHYAHNRADDITAKKLGIVHRDISPQNILLSFEGEIKVTDFGIAEADSKINETKPGIVKGKYSYMSPEQIMAKPVDHRTDIFALGIVLWEALGMKKLFQGINEVETIQLVKNCKIEKDLKELNPEVDDILMSIVEKALKKDLKERYQSSADFEQDLRRYIASIDPNFSKIHLSDFLKEILNTKYQEFQKNIGDALGGIGLESPSTEVSDTKEGSPPPPLPKLETEFKLADVEKPEALPDGSSPGHTKHNNSANGDDLLTFGIMHKPSEVQENSKLNSPEDFTGLNLSKKSKSELAESESKEKPLKATAPSWAQQSAVSRSTPSSMPGKPFLIQAIAVVCLMVASGGGYYYYLQSKPTSQSLEVEFTPRRALLYLNGNLVNKSYLESPQVLSDLPLGDYEITVRREGFSDTKTTVSLNGKKLVKNINLALKRTAPLAPVEFRISRDSSFSKVEYEFQDNLEVGTINKGKLERVRDLLYGKTYKVAFSSAEGKFLCKFQARSRTWTRPYIVLVYPEDKKCKFSAPKSK